MPTTSHGPKLLKGTIVAIDLQTAKQTAIVFQYNPKKLTRTIKPGQMEPSGTAR